MLKIIEKIFHLLIDLKTEILIRDIYLIRKSIDLIYVLHDAKKNLYLTKRKEYPRVFYSYFEVKNLLKTTWVSIDDQSLLNKLLNKFNKLLTSFFTLIFENFDLSNTLMIKKLNKAKIVYATNDFITLKLALLKKEKKLKAKLVGNLFSILDDEHHFKNIDLLKYVDQIVVFSKSLEQKLIDLSFKHINFVKFGVDINYYNSKKVNQISLKNEGKTILGLGLDRRRDWDLFKKIAQEMPFINFRVITDEKFRKSFSDCKNIKFLGKTHPFNVRNEIFLADILFLPSKNNNYFAGQTTMFIALAMKRPVIMPYDLNVDAYNLDKTLFYSRDCHIKDIIELINLTIYNTLTIKKSVVYNHNLIIHEYNQVKLAYRLKEIFAKFY